MIDHLTNVQIRNFDTCFPGESRAIYISSVPGFYRLGYPYSTKIFRKNINQEIPITISHMEIHFTKLNFTLND